MTDGTIRLFVESFKAEVDDVCSIILELDFGHDNHYLIFKELMDNFNEYEVGLYFNRFFNEKKERDRGIDGYKKSAKKID